MVGYKRQLKLVGMSQDQTRSDTMIDYRNICKVLRLLINDL